jgi:hypothetical protein
MLLHMLGFVSLLAACSLIDIVHADAFIWGEYAADNDLDPQSFLSPKSWVATRCSKFKGAETYPAAKKCSDGGDCLEPTESCKDKQPCICNDGKKDNVKHLGFTGNEEVRCASLKIFSITNFFVLSLVILSSSISELRYCDAMPVSSH